MDPLDLEWYTAFFYIYIYDVICHLHKSGVIYRYDSNICVLVSHKCQSCCSSFDSVAMLNLETYDLVLQGSNIINVKLVLTLLHCKVFHSCHP